MGRIFVVLTDDMKSIIKNANLAFFATINEDGSPNLSPKSTLRTINGDSLIFANLASPGTIRNLNRDPRIEINCVDIFSRRGYRFTGVATVHVEGETTFEKFKTQMAKELGPKTIVYNAVTIQIKKVSPIMSPAYNNPNVTEERLRETYLKKYGVSS